MLEHERGMLNYFHHLQVGILSLCSSSSTFTAVMYGPMGLKEGRWKFPQR